MEISDDDFEFAPLLTILIPTYNRLNHVIELLDSFCSNLKVGDDKLIEFVISENVPKSRSQLIKVMSSYSKFLKIKLVNPPKHLISAEENLFFGWQYVSGKYVWTLGDDDPVNFEVFSNLLDRCKDDSHLIIKYNADLLSNNKVDLGKVTKSAVNEVSMPLRDFLQIVGFWHTGAGFSTWIFKSSLIEPALGLAWVQSFKSPVYAHVTFFLNSCANQNVTFVNKPLVLYRVNSYVDEETGVNHWDKYTAEVKMPRFYPWTLGFINQLLRLESNGVIDRKYWGAVLGDHVGSKRFLEFNSMVSLTIQQFNLQKHNPANGFSESEASDLLQFFKSIRPDLHHLWILCELYVKTSSEEKRLREHLIQRIFIAWYANLFLDPFRFHRISRFKYSYRIGTLDFTVNRRREIQERLSLGISTRQPKLNLGQQILWSGPLSLSIIYFLSQGLARFAPDYIITIIFRLAKRMKNSKHFLSL